MSNVKNVKQTYARSIRVSPFNDKRVNPHKRSFLCALAKTAVSFCEESTLHGLKNAIQNARGLRDNNVSK